MNIIDAATATVDDYPGGARSLAPRIPKAESTLCHEVTETHGAKLGARTAARMVRLTGDTRIMQAFVQECGYSGVFVRAVSPPLDAKELQQAAQVVKEAADTVTAFAAALADGKVTGSERDEIMRQASEAHEALQRLCEYADALYAAGRPQLKVVSA